MGNSLIEARKKVDSLDLKILKIFFSLNLCRYESKSTYSKELVKDQFVLDVLKKICRGKRNARTASKKDIKELILLLKKRMHLTTNTIKKIKDKQNQGYHDQKREQLILSNVKKAALEKGLIPRTFIDSYRLILKQSKMRMS